MSQTYVYCRTKESKPSAEERIKNENVPSNEINNNIQNDDKKDCKKKIKIIAFISLIILICIIIIVLLVVYKPWKKQPNIIPEDEVKNEDEDEDETKTEKELKHEDYKNELLFTTKVNDLRRLLIIKNSDEDMTIDGIKVKTKLFSKTYIDIYIISEKDAPQEYKNLYNKTYSASISTVSQCLSRENDDCQLKDLVDLANNKKVNLRNLNEIDDLKDIPIPLCLFNFSDTNIIISISCPESLSENIKNEILSYLHYFRPNSKTSSNKVDEMHINAENNIKNIRKQSKGLCDAQSGVNSHCELDTNITKNSEGYLLEVNENSFTNITTDSKNSFIKSKKTKLVDETELNNLNPDNYKTILNDLLEKLNPYIKKGESISVENIVKQYKSQSLINKIDNIRHLTENDNIYHNTFVKEESLFYKEIFGAKISLNLKIDSGLNVETMKSMLNLKFDNKEKELVNNVQFSNLNKIIQKLISLANAGNTLAYQLYEKIKNNLDNLTQEITIQISNLNSLIVYKDLTEIFDSTLSLNSLKVLPIDIIEESNNLMNKLNLELNNIDNEKSEFNNYTNKFQNDINDYLQEEYNLMNNTFNNLTNLKTLLKSPKNLFTEIYTYYSNNTPTSYIDIYNRVQDLFTNFNQRRNTNINNNIESSLSNFEQNYLDSIEKSKIILNSMYSKLKNESITIENASKEDYENIISYLYNSNNNSNIILNKIKDIIREIFSSKNKEYKLSESEEKEKNITLNESSDISKILDNDEIIDKLYDSKMNAFKDNITKIIKDMDKLKIQKFTLIDDVLEENLFSSTQKMQMKNDISSCGVNIINNIKRENNYYINKIKETVNKFIEENSANLNSVILDLNILLSEESLLEISDYFDYAFFSSLQAILNDIEYIKGLVQDYYKAYNTSLEFALSKIRDSSEFTVLSYVRTINQSYFIYHDILKSNLQKLRNYINNQLYNDFLDEYKFMIVRIKEILLSIKNNKVSEIYPGISEFEFYDDHVNIINNLSNRIDNFFSLDLFNNIYLPLLNDFKVNNTEKRFEIINNFIDAQHKVFSKLGLLEDDPLLGNDYYLCLNMTCQGKYTTYKYCIKYFIHDYITETNFSIFAKGNLESREKFENISGIIDENANFYNSKINIIKNSLLSIEQDVVNQNITFGYLIPIQNKINLLLSQKYGEEIIKYSYNYYKNNIEGKIENILNSIDNKWIESFNSLEMEINENLNEFKYPIKEFGIMAQLYEELYSKNISSEYFDSIINLEKNEFNFTISYYYNYLLELVNSTYLYIINNIPSNKMMLNEIVNLRKNEIKDEFENIIKSILESKANMLNINTQLNILENDEQNFFKLNSILNNHINNTSNYLKNKALEILKLDNKKANDEYSIATKLYSDISDFGKQINKFYEEISDNLYIDLNSVKFKNIISKNWNQDDIINQLNLTLFNTNKDIYIDFLIIKENLTTVLEKEINQYFTKNSIFKKINELYYYGIAGFNSTIKNSFNNNLFGILDRIYEHFWNESKRINTTLVSYNSDFSVINNTINSYKVNIYEEIKAKYVEIIDDFRKNMINKVYTEYIEKGLNDYKTETKKYTDNFKEYKLLNSTYNLKEIIDEIIDNLIYEYKELILRQIDYKYYATLNYILKLDSLEEFLDDEMEYEYTTILLKVLKEKAIYTPGDTGYSQYDLSDNIKNDINSVFNTNINNIKNLLPLIKGVNYEANINKKGNTTNGVIILIDDPQWKDLDFSRTYEQLLKIETYFEAFISSEINYEKNYINEKVNQIIKSNFNTSLINIISSFGNDFFERSFKYNEYFKINDLYDNLEYSLDQSVNFYLSKINELKNISNKIPKELKERIYNLNNIELLVVENNNYLMEKINLKNEEFVSDLKDDLINSYIDFMGSDSFIYDSFTQNIRQIIYNNLNIARSSIEEEYTDILKSYLKEKFTLSYNETLNEKSDKLINLINNYRNTLMIELDNLTNLESENILEEINYQIEKIYHSIDDYNYHINRFKFPEEFEEYLNEFGLKNIKPIYDEFKNQIDKISNNQIISNFEKNSNNYENSFKLEEFVNLSNATFLNIQNNHINNMISYLNDYNSNFTSNFNKEIYKENNELIDNPMDETFPKLISSLDNTKIFIETLKEFNDYDTIIIQNINNINLAFKESRELIDKNNYEEENKNDFINKLIYLKEMSLDYYHKINESYYNLREYLNNSIQIINEDINNFINITYDTLIKEYKKLYDQEEVFNEEYSKNEESLNTIYYTFTTEDTDYYISAKINNLEHYSKYYMELFFENNFKNPKLITSIINKSRPKNMILDIYTLYGNCAQKGVIIETNFNDATYKMDLDIQSTKMNAITTTNFEKYEYTNEVYEIEDSDEVMCFVVAYINFCLNVSKCRNKISLSNEKFFNDKKESMVPNSIKY